MPFLMAVIALDLRNIFLFLLRNDIDTHGKRVGVTILSPFSAAAGTLLVVLILLWVGKGSLLSGK